MRRDVERAGVLTFLVLTIESFPLSRFSVPSVVRRFQGQILIRQLADYRFSG